MDPEKILLHSRYNPQAEADRYINSLSLNEAIRFFILIEPGLGYMIAPLKKKFPSAKIICLHADDFFGKGISVQDYLENEIPDSEAGEIKMIEWRPALAVYGKVYLSLVEETVSFIKRADANTRTTKAFGRRWFMNFLKNSCLIKNVICPASFSIPIVVAGAGPGLESAIPLIRGEVSRSKIFILAAASSVMCLKAANINPDMVISTDGGNWAALHIHECYRGGNYSGGSGAFPIAVSMTAALPSQCEEMTFLPIADGSIWQTLILEKLDIPFVTLPQRGTVSASAIDLAFSLTNGSIYIAGMDLANNDIRSHARPYSFDRLSEEKAVRLNPIYSQAFKRSSLLKAGGSYGIYASWFEKQLRSYPKRLSPLGKNNPLFNSQKKTTGETINEVFPVNSYPALGNSSLAHNKVVNIKNVNTTDKAIKVLENALMDSDPISIKVYKELTGLLFPGRTGVSKSELIETIHSPDRKGKD